MIRFGEQLLLFFVPSFLMVTAFPQWIFAQDIESNKAGVVRIQNDQLNEVGSGIVVKIDKDHAYIITAAHVVKRAAHPTVYLFNHPRDPLVADLVNKEDDDQKGLALLLVKADPKRLRGIVPLKFGTLRVRGGDAVSVIGFPDGTEFWSITSANISRIEGRNLVFSGPIRGGNSGGPVLLNGQIIGLVTDTIQDLDYAVLSENLMIYIKGFPFLADLFKETESSASAVPLSPENAKFCQALNQIIASSHNDFASIVDPKTSYSAGDLLDSLIKLPGTYTGTIFVESKYVRFIVDDSKARDAAGSEYYKLASTIKLCMPAWRVTDSSKDPSKESSNEYGSRIQPPNSKYYRFSDNSSGVVIQVEQFSTDIAGSRSYVTTVSIYASNSGQNPERSSSAQRDAQSVLGFIGDEDRADEICQSIAKLVEASHSDFYSILKPTRMSGFFDSTLGIPGFPSPMVAPRDRAVFTINAGDHSAKETLYYRLIGIVGSCLADWKRKESSGDSVYSKNDRFFQLFDNKSGSVVEIRNSFRGATYENVTFNIYSPNSPSRPK